jgi:hypothetical protein
VSGIVVPVLRQSAFNHSFLSSSATEEIIVADRIPTAPFTTIGLSVRVHKRNLGTGASYQFIIRGINPSDEDGADFVFATDLGSTSATTAAANPTAVPGLIALSAGVISNTQHPMIRVVLKATGGTTAVNTYIVVSADLVMRAG